MICHSRSRPSLISSYNFSHLKLTDLTHAMATEIISNQSRLITQRFLPLSCYGRSAEGELT